MRQIIEKHPIMGILRNVSDEVLIPYTAALYEGGIRSLEISFTTVNASKQIKAIKTHFPKDITVGAGTILTPAQAEEALESGAEFLLSPSTDIPVLRFCQEHNTAFLPGVFSPSDISTALSYGFDMLKLFPAGELPMHYLKSLKGPFPQADFIAVGGVTPENITTFLSHGYKGVGIGSSLTPNELIMSGNWQEIAAVTNKLFSSLKEREVISK